MRTLRNCKHATKHNPNMRTSKKVTMKIIDMTHVMNVMVAFLLVRILGLYFVACLQFRRVRTTVQPYFEFRRKDHP